MGRYCFRNTEFEDYHAGTFPSSKTGDYSDDKVVSPFGEIAWNKLSRLSDEEMRNLMIDVVDHCYKFLLELFVSGRGEDLISMLKRRDLLATWYDPVANGPSTVGDA
jgi:hypothetical protein